MAEEKSAFWQGAEAEELLLHYIALKRQHELVTEYQRYAAEAATNPLETPALDEKIRNMSNDYYKNGQRSHRRQIWRKGLQVAAILLAIVLACPTIAFAVSPAFRESVVEYVLDWQDDHVGIQVNQPGEDADFRYYLPTWLPDGFQLTDQISEPTFCTFTYEDSDQYINLAIQSSSAVTNMDTDTTIIDVEQQINGNKAIVGYNGSIYSIVWQDSKANFTIYSTLSFDETLKFAESIIYEKQVNREVLVNE